jgi:hypothetical protein
MASTPSQRMGPSPGASPPMRIAASWSRPHPRASRIQVCWAVAPMASSPRIVRSRSCSSHAGRQETAKGDGLTTVAPYKPAPAKAGGKPMPRRTARANGRKSAVRSAVEHVFARQKGPMGLFVRTIGIARAKTKIGLVNLVYNMQRMVWLTAQTAAA